MKGSLAAYWHSLAKGGCERIPGRLLILVLMPFSLLYAFIQTVRLRFYQSGILKAKYLPRPVISVGNITVGGTGKTPVTAYIARFLMAQGLRVAVLSRGYGGSLEGTTAIVSDGTVLLLEPEQCGDEPFLLAQTIPGLMVVIGADRYAAGVLAISKLSPDIFILDDGFQHLRLHRDLDILLLDYRSPFGNGWTLPAGMLRESSSAVDRADIVILTRCPDGALSAAAVPGKPVCYARHHVSAARPFSEDALVPFTSLQNHTFLAFAGIAEPYYFFDGLRAQGLNIAATIVFPDHTAYTESQIAEITLALRSCGAGSVITTEKDGVKLTHLSENISQKLFLARLELTLEDPSPLAASLRNLLQK
jgi:tetraacyldisaccharide 4'-kinase